jgi:hypothetical protein
MDRKLWLPADGIDKNTRNKHCGNCRFGILAMDGVREMSADEFVKKHGDNVGCSAGSARVGIDSTGKYTISECGNRKHYFKVNK